MLALDFTGGWATSFYCGPLKLLESVLNDEGRLEHGDSHIIYQHLPLAPSSKVSHGQDAWSERFCK